MISFIHIGKTGGSTIRTILGKKVLSGWKHYHMTKEYNDREKYIIWIRNPLSRFVSAFNQSYWTVNADVNNDTVFTLSNSLIPPKMKKKRNMGFAFTREYDDLINSFTSANELAESLSSADTTKKELAESLMRHEKEHIFKGIGWHLNNGVFVKWRHDRILFVGRMEYMEEDIGKLSTKLGIKLNNKVKIRENVFTDKSKKYLSPLAIKNLLEWYKGTDYAALKQLLNFGFIDQATYDSYFNYDLVL